MVGGTVTLNKMFINSFVVFFLPSRAVCNVLFYEITFGRRPLREERETPSAGDIQTEM